MLLLRSGPAQVPENLEQPTGEEQKPRVELQESPTWKAERAATSRVESPSAPAPKWGPKPPTAPHSGTKQPPGQKASEERPSDKGAAPSGNQSPRQTPEGQASQLSGWSGTAGWGGSSANSAWGNVFIDIGDQ
eukprot:4934408-Amphidinium_carterae.1